MYYRARYYNPTIGQFTQPDTHTPPGPPGLNRHAYTNGNPIAYTDPTGHECFISGPRAGQCWQGPDGPDDAATPEEEALTVKIVTEPTLQPDGTMSPGGENIRYTLYGDVTGAEIIRNHRNTRSELFPEANRTAFYEQNYYDQYDLRAKGLGVPGWIADNWTNIVAGAVCIGASLGTCAAAVGGAFLVRTAVRDGPGNAVQPWKWSKETWTDLGVTGTLFAAGTLVTAPVSMAAGESSAIGTAVPRIGQGSVLIADSFVYVTTTGTIVPACTVYDGKANGVCG